MVRVVGKDDKHVHKVTCKNCASILEYVMSEEKSFVSTDYGGGRDTNYYVDCPECQDKVITRVY